MEINFIFRLLYDIVIIMVITLFILSVCIINVDKLIFYIQIYILNI